MKGSNKKTALTLTVGAVFVRSSGWL